MTSSGDPNPAAVPGWLSGRGRSPRLSWTHGTDGQLTGLAYSREAGLWCVADESGGLMQLDSDGRITTLTRFPGQIAGLVASDDGSQYAVIADESEVVRLDARLQVLQRIQLPDVVLSLALTPFGNHLAVSLASGATLIYNERKRRIARFETLRPLAFLAFSHSQPLLFGAAEHGLLCCHQLSGEQVWQQSNWSNVGRLRITGDGDLMYLASFAHGVQTLDGDGAPVGSYVIEGTVHRLDVSYEPRRLIAATIERSLCWLDADGEVLWATMTPDDVRELVCDPLGEWAGVGMKSDGVALLSWTSPTKTSSV